ncbi:hypothetical protein C8A03DRAFT_47531 [Achaetomium macrosporum]|uniref:BTB domain-containing protein n=1 Tax=Achaetomium macrosporum TaxID=79813 RepID=A0AAN7H7T6_9PEZI|nr:hypothetical protein C8A03DRAFT_47531 [Achaetomium macrosporum]
MEQIRWEDIASSKMFRFSVGPQKREFTMHSALVAHQSPALKTLVANTQFKEAREAHAELEEYAYTGDYHAAVEGVSCVNEDTDKKDATSIDQRGRRPHIRPAAPSSILTSRGHISGQSRKNKPWEIFDTIVKQMCRSTSPRGHVAVDAVALDHGAEGFLRHVRVYLFADCYGIKRLMDLVLCKLGQALRSFPLGGERVEDIIALLRYCYDNAAPERLRSLLVLYTACNVQELWKTNTFKALLEAHDELSVAVIESLVERLNQMD